MYMYYSNESAGNTCTCTCACILSMIAQLNTCTVYSTIFPVEPLTIMTLTLAIYKWLVEEEYE